MLSLVLLTHAEKRSLEDLLNDLNRGDASKAGYAILDLQRDYSGDPKTIRALIDHLGDGRPVKIIQTIPTGVSAATVSGNGDISGMCASALVVAQNAAIDPLISIIKGSDVENGIDSYQFRQALNCLGSIGNRKAVNPIYSYLNRKSAKMPGAAIQALGNIGDPESWSYIRRYLKSEDDDTRATTIIAARQILGDKAASILLPSLNDQEPKVKKYTLYALMQLPFDQQIMDAVSQCLSDKDSSVRKTAFDYFEYSGACAKAIPILLREFETNANQSRTHAIKAISNCSDTRSVSTISDLMRKENHDLVLAAIRAAAHIKANQLINPLIILFQKSNTDPNTRCLIVDALAATATPEAISELALLRGDPDTQVNQRITLALRENPSSSADDMALRNLDSRDIKVLKAAIEQVGEGHNKKAVTQLCTLLKNAEDTDLEKLILSAIGRIGSQETIHTVIHKFWDQRNLPLQDDFAQALVGSTHYYNLDVEEWVIWWLEKLHDNGNDPAAAAQQASKSSAINEIMQRDSILHLWAKNTAGTTDFPRVNAIRKEAQRILSENQPVSGVSWAITIAEFFKTSEDQRLLKAFLSMHPEYESQIQLEVLNNSPSVLEPQNTEDKTIQSMIDDLIIEGRMGNKKVIINGKVYRVGDTILLDYPLKLEAIKPEQILFSSEGVQYPKSF